MTIFLIAAAAVCALCIIVTLICYKLAFYSPLPHNEDPKELPPDSQYLPHAERMHSMVDHLQSLPYEQVFITSHDGLRLAGRYYHRNDGAPVKIEFHGYRSAAVRDFCGAHELDVLTGCNVLLIDQRAHGLSDGTSITFGILERHDVVSWVNYVVNRFGSDVKILLSGVSMGAATVMMASDLDLPSNVRGIIADCGYSSPKAILMKVCQEDYHLPAKLLYPFCRLAAKWLCKCDLEEASALSSVKNSKVPIFIVHGTDDRFVPCSMAHELKAAAGDKAELHLFEGSGHVLSYLDDTPRYHKLAQAFCDRIFE